MLALLNGPPNIVTQYFWVALLCSQSTGGSCGWPDIYNQLFVSAEQCEQWAVKEATHYARHLCMQVRYTVDIGRPYESASEFYKDVVK